MDLAEAINVGELLARLFQKDDRFLKAKSPLKETCFMDNV